PGRGAGGRRRPDGTRRGQDGRARGPGGAGRAGLGLGGRGARGGGGASRARGDRGRHRRGAGAHRADVVRRDRSVRALPGGVGGGGAAIGLTLPRREEGECPRSAGSPRTSFASFRGRRWTARSRRSTPVIWTPRGACARG